MNENFSAYPQLAATPENWQSSKVKLIALSVLITGILYYCYAYLLRVFPSIMEQELLSHFFITAGAFGNLTAFYYYSYAPMQLPVGVIVDRYGARRSLIIACLISVFGVLIFSTARHLAQAEVGRFMIGFGSAFAYVTVLKLSTIWLPRRYFATATCITTGCGMLAAVITDTYLTSYLQTFGFAATLHFCLLLGIALLVLIATLIRDKPKEDIAARATAVDTGFAISYQQLGKYLWILAKNPQMWIIGLIGALMYLPASVLIDVWGIPYFQAVYHFTKEDAGMTVSLVTMGWIIFSPIAGVLSDRFGSRKIPLILSTFIATLIAVTIFYVPHLPRDVLFLLLFLLGAACASHPLTFTLGKENNSTKIAGTSVAFTNFLIMLGGVFFQPLVGKILDMGWSGQLNQGIRLYSAHDFAIALTILPLSLLLAFVLTFCLRETFSRTAKE